MNVFVYYKTLTIRFDNIVAIIFQKTVYFVKAVTTVYNFHITLLSVMH